MNTAGGQRDIHIAQLLGDEVALYRLLVDLLHAEQQALTQGLIDDLERITREKSACVSQINEIEKQRLTDTGQPASQADTPSSPHMHPLWPQLTALATQARELNQANGRMINMRLQRTQDALSALRGQDATLSAGYGPDGQPLGSGKGRPLSSA